MIHGLFDNITIVALCLLLVAQLFRSRSFGSQAILKDKISLGFIFGIFGIALMINSIRISPTIIVDLRNIALLCAAILGGPIALGISSIMVAGYRLMNFGINNASIVAAIVALAICAAGSIISKININRSIKFISIFLSTMLFSNIALIYLIKDVGRLKQILPAYWLVYVSGAVLAYFGLEYIIYVNRVLREMEYYKLMTNNLTDMLSTHEVGGKYLYASPSTERLTGYRSEELIGQNAYSLMHPEDVEILKNWNRKNQTQDSLSYTFRMRKKDGNYIWVESSVKTLTNRDGSLKETVVITRDITSRVEIEKELRESENKFRSLVNSMNDIVYTLDQQQRFTGVFGNWVQDMGVSQEHLLGKTHRQIWGEEAAKQHEEAHLKALEGENAIYDWTIVTPFGTASYQTMLSPIRNVDGKVIGIVGVGRDLTVQKRMEEMLHRKNEELKMQQQEAIEANRLKSQFLANMSHELRTPLNSIIGFTNRVMKKCKDVLPTTQYENLAIVKDEGEHLLDLINNLLDYSKIEAGKMELHLEEFDLMEVINEVCSMTANLLETKALCFKQTVYTTEPIQLVSDRMKLKQIMINLVSNAIKYSERGTVELSVECSNSFYCIKVKDEGIGISKEDIDSIFDEFRQLDNSYSRKIGGTGLGLSITKKFVEMLNGRIEISSEVGVGSCFTVYIPKNDAV